MPTTYAELDTEIQNRFGEANYQAVLDLATEGLQQFPAEHPMLNYWRMCAAARLNQPGNVYRILSESLESNFWYGEALLRQSPSFKSLLGQPTFELLAGLCRDRQAADGGGPVLRVLKRGEPEQPPLLVALHGNQSSAENTQPLWQPAAEQGWLVALPQSTGMMWKGVHIWTEPEVAQSEVLMHMVALSDQQSFDSDRLVLGGHSMGGEMAIWVALNGMPPVRGFVVIGPGGPLCDEPEQWKPLIEANADPDLRGYFILGGNDPLILPDKLREVARLFNAAGMQCEVEVVPEATHDPHPGYAAVLMRGLAFVLGQ